MKKLLMVFVFVCLSWGLADGSSTVEVVTSDLEKAQALVDKEDFQGAAHFLKLLLARESDNADYHNLMGFSLRRMDDFEGSLEHYFMALEIDPQHLGANEYLGELYLKLNDLENAEVQLGALASFGCEAGCEQFDMLEAAIDTYQKTGSVDW